jgi:rSAM/selenodomain-associated transferase 1
MPDGMVAVLAKAPVPGFAKTRLIPLLGPHGAAALQQRLIERALATALEAGIGPVTLWCAPDDSHPFFLEAARRHGVHLAVQPDGDLGERMLTAFRSAPSSTAPVLIGTDCPVLDPADLRDAAALLDDADVVIAPAEDGGYGLIAGRRPAPALFERMPWGTEWVAALTRDRAQREGLRLAEIRTIWDVDTPADFERLYSADLLDIRDLAPRGVTNARQRRS